MRLSNVASAVMTALLFAGAGAVARAQEIHVIRPAHGAIVRETVQVKVAPSDLPADGYAAIYIDDQFRVARTLPSDTHDPVYVWDTKASGPNGAGVTADGSHTLKVVIFSGSKQLGSDTVPVRVANQISPPSPALKLTYHWPTQHKLIYHRVTSLTVPGDQSGPSAGTVIGAAPTTPPADQPLQSADLSFARTTKDVSADQSTLRDIVISGTVTNHGQTQTILSGYNIQPQLKTVNAHGDVLSRVPEDDLMDHIGFPVPELPARRVGEGDRWLEPVLVPLNWDGSSRASVQAECSLEGFEWQNNYPTAKIRETYSGPATFTPQPATASGHAPPPSFTASTITYDRVLYLAYGSGRLIKDVSNTQVTLTAAQLALLGGTPPVSVASPDAMGGPAPGVGGQPYLNGLPSPAQAADPTSFTLNVTQTDTLQTP